MKKEIPLVYKQSWRDWCRAGTDLTVLVLCHAELVKMFNMGEIPSPETGDKLTAVVSTIRPTGDDDYYEVRYEADNFGNMLVAEPYGISRRIDTYSKPRRIVADMVPPGYPVFFWLEYGDEV